MIRPKILFPLISSALLIATGGPDCTGQIPYQVIPLTATVQESPASITIQWPADDDAPFFKLKRREASSLEWVDLAVVPGSATSYIDQDVVPGDVWEYTVISNEPLHTSDTVCVAPGAAVTFTIYDTEGNGLCCWNSDGHWELYACGELIATGAEYGGMDQHQFTMCGIGDCEEVVVRIYPDHDFTEISWELVREQDMLIASGAPDMAPMFGYILAGIKAPPVEQPGSILLLVDQQHAGPLEMELERLRRDLIGEGWLVKREDVSADLPVTTVKELVLDAAGTHPDLAAIFLIGQVPIPYSGKVAPDGHMDHLGAWPADLYYAELDGPWTDQVVDWTYIGIHPRNHNVPGDGKFDQSTLPSDVDLIIGRVDLSNLPVHATEEVELLRAYLDRDHAFRTGQMTFGRKAVIDEHFSWLDHEAAAYRSCIPMFGHAAVYEAPFISSLANESHLWSMAGGPGMYTSAFGIGTSADVAATPLNGAFAHLLGSYFGDWDNQNNFMRSVLASGTMLGVVWGLQELAFHHMALGGTIGESVRRTQNSHYAAQERHGRLIHTALMGDPTLQLLPAKHLEALDADSTPFGVELSWAAVEDDIIGYHVYRRPTPDVHFDRITDSPVEETNFLDTDPENGVMEYMVRPLKLETTASGTFHVLGTGRTAQVSFTVSSNEIRPDETSIHPIPNQGNFTVRSTLFTDAVQVKLLDLSGKEVGFDVIRGHGSIQISTEAGAGMYLLQLIRTNGTVLQRPVSIIH